MTSLDQAGGFACHWGWAEPSEGEQSTARNRIALAEQVSTADTAFYRDGTQNSTINHPTAHLLSAHVGQKIKAHFIFLF